MMKKIQAASAVALALSSVSFAQQAVQWRVSEGGNGHWYLLLQPSVPVTWQAGQTTAASQGAHLATITSQAENRFLAGYIEANIVVPWGAGLLPEGCWLGGRKVDGSWSWCTGEAWAFTGWHQSQCIVGGGNQPDADGAATLLQIACLSGGECRWDDICYSSEASSCTRPFILIEWSADCNGDGIVDYGQCRDGSLPDYNGNNIPDCCESGTPCVVGSYPVQWRAEDGGNGHWYSQSGFGLFPSWSAALEFARSRGAYLATLTSQQEQSFVASLARPATCEGGGGWSWLGAQQPPGLPPNQGWQWITDEPWIFTNWAPGEPNDFGGLPEDRLSMYLSTGNIGLWNDGTDLVSNPASCNYSAMLEWSADCNSDGIVDKGQILRGQLADSDNDGIPNVCECVCDVFRDFNVNGIDLGILLGQWGPANQFTVTDFNQDGSVDGSDLGVLLGAWGPCPN